MGEAKQEAAKAARSPWSRGLARWGLVSKGFLYALVGLIAVDVSVAGGKRIRDRGGALSALADTWSGKLLVGEVAVGLLGYSLWRFAEVLLGRTLDGGEQLGLLKRLGVLARGVWYLGLLGVAVSTLAGADDRPTGRTGLPPGCSSSRPGGGWWQLSGSASSAPESSTSGAG